MKRKHLLLNEDDGTGSQGDGGGAGGLDDTPPADPPAEPSGGAEPPADVSGPEWAKGFKLDAEILNDPALQAIGDVEALTKSYVHAQRKIGQKGVLLPSENSTKEEWDTFYQKTGVPLEEQTYSAKFEFKEEGAFDSGFNEDFVKKAHELRIHPSQAAQMYEFFENKSTTTAENFQKDMEEKSQQQLDALREQYGPDAYDVHLAKAQKLIKEEGGEEFLGYLKESGLGRNAQVVDAFMKIANKFYGEEKIPRGKSDAAVTRDQAQQEINLVMGNFDDPYHRADHPDHKRRVDEVNKYFAKLG